MFGRGGAAIVEPSGGEVIAGPLYDEEGIVSADCDLSVGLHAKRWFDSVGHYSREDVLLGEVPLSGTGGADGGTAQEGSSSNSTSPTTTSSPRSKPAR